MTRAGIRRATGADLPVGDTRQRLLHRRYERLWQNTYKTRAWKQWLQYRQMTLLMKTGKLVKDYEIKIWLIRQSEPPHDWPQMRKRLAEKVRELRRQLRQR